MRRLPARRVRLRTLWLEPDDYPVFLGCADLGLSLHRSASGVDLPMKVADLLGSGVPVCALDYAPCVAEQVRHGENGVLFSDAASLAAQLFELLEGFPDRVPRLRQLRANVEAAHTPRWDEEWDENAYPVLFPEKG
jgi:beta-1,4-mannosyltransferase